MVYKKLGILGGMGPLATYNLYKSIIESTQAKRDQDHINMVILNASCIPDRTEAILYNKESPLPHLLRECAVLENAQCDVIAIPCNTAHHYYRDIQQGCNIKIINMIDLVAQHLSQLNVSDVLLLATRGTVEAEIYTKYMDSISVNLHSTNNDETNAVMEIIYGIKANKSYDIKKINIISKKYFESKCEKIILGCTELSLIKRHIVSSLKKDNIDEEIDNYFIDPSDILKNEILSLFRVC